MENTDGERYEVATHLRYYKGNGQHHEADSATAHPVTITTCKDLLPGHPGSNFSLSGWRRENNTPNHLPVPRNATHTYCWSLQRAHTASCRQAHWHCPQGPLGSNLLQERHPRMSGKYKDDLGCPWDYRWLRSNSQWRWTSCPRKTSCLRGPCHPGQARRRRTCHPGRISNPCEHSHPLESGCSWHGCHPQRRCTSWQENWRCCLPYLPLWVHPNSGGVCGQPPMHPQARHPQRSHGECGSKRNWTRLALLTHKEVTGSLSTEGLGSWPVPDRRVHLQHLWPLRERERDRRYRHGTKEM